VLEFEEKKGGHEVITRNLGAVYTPDILADWVAAELVRRLPRTKSLLVIDPACGDGALLRSVLRTGGRSGIRVAGLDVDPTAIRKAQQLLPKSTFLKSVDALQPSGKGSAVETGWKRLMEDKIAGVISNPPWGADLSQSAADLRGAGYHLAQGQFDSYELFIELCLKVMPKGAMLAFIIPDSIFLPEHKALRTLLLERSQLHLIARLGEGFFDQVYRGTAVVVCEKTTPRLTRSIECFRLKKDLRAEVLSNRLSLQDAKAKEVHLIPQKDFHSDPERRFSIDVSRDDQSAFHKINKQRSNWATWLTSGRGVELSKTGSVILCPLCKTARPTPREQIALICQNCGVKFEISSAIRKTIVKRSRIVPAGWKRLIVGEDVDRYSCVSSRIIENNVPGINYKTPSSFEGSKLLVRKTGVGIKAAIDDSGALTNQVVFHYRAKPIGTPSFFLDYVLGILCSRVMLAYHLKRTGENEWRSHPYVTQKTIAELPVPVISEGGWKWRQAKAIAGAVSERRQKKPSDSVADLYVDSLVAGLYDLDSKACAWVLNVLDEAQSLQSITTMRADVSQLRAVRV
jgi:hypothetical protein